MACLYTYKDLSSTSIYDLIEQISKEVSINLDLNKLVFHRAKLTRDQIVDKINDLHREYARMKSSGEEMGQSVTDIKTDLFKSNLNYTVTPETLFAKKWAPEMGEQVHNLIRAGYEKKNWDAAVNSFYKVVEEAQADLATKSLNYDLVTGKLPWILLTKKDPKPLEEFVQKVLNTPELKGKKLLFERNVYCKAPSGEPMHGRFDLVAVGDDGKLLLIDFKTSGTETLYKQVESAHYAQVALYRSMLVEREVCNEEDVLVTIGHIGFDKATGYVTAGTVGKGIFNLFDLPHMRVNSIEYKIEIDQKLRKYFPLTNTVMTEPQQKEALTKIVTFHKNIFVESFLNRDNPESYIACLDKLNEDDQYRCKKDGKYYKIESEGDNYILTDLNNGNRRSVLKTTFVEEEIEADKSTSATRYQYYITALKSKDLDLVKGLVNSTRNANGLLLLMELFMGPEWEVVEDPVFTSQNIIVLYNNLDKSYSFINLTNLCNLDRVYTLKYKDGLNRTLNILGNVLSLEVLDNFPQADMEASLNKIMFLKTLSTIAMYDNLHADGGRIRINSITNLSTTSGNNLTFFDDYQELIALFRIPIVAAEKKEIKADVPMLLDFKDIDAFYNSKVEFVSSIDRLMSFIHSVLFQAITDPDIAKYNFDKINSIRDTEKDVQLKIKILIEYRDNLEVNYKEFITGKEQDLKNLTHPIQRLYYQINAAIAALNKMLTSEAYTTSSTGATFDSSIRAGVDLILSGKIGHFTATGEWVAGFLQGLETASPFAIPDRYNRAIVQLLTDSFSRASYEAEQIILENNEGTTEWLKTKEGNFRTFIIGYHRPLYALLFKQNEKGEVSEAMKFKNPYEDTASLTDADKKYIKLIIWNLYRVQKNDSDFSQEEKAKSFKEISKNPEFDKKFKELLAKKSHFLNIPLRSAQDGKLMLESTVQLVKGNFKEAADVWKRRIKKITSVVDNRGLTDEQEKRKQEHVESFKAYNMYTDIDNRTKHIGGNPNKFEFNVNFLANDFIYNIIQCDIQLDVLDTTKAIISTIRGLELMTGRNLDNLVDAIMARTRISLFNMDNVDEKWKDVVKAVRVLRQGVTFTKIALRPALLLKELTAGRVRNHLYSSMGYFENEGITYSDMVKAEAIVFREGITDKINKFSGKSNPGDRAKVEALNYILGIANVDSNVKSQKSMADRFGIMNVSTDLSYYNSTRPDWYNRMAIVVAKLIHDGTWDAISVDKDTNRLIYDMSKDAKYSLYWAYKGNEPSPRDPRYKQYQEQKAKYLWALRSFKRAGFTKPDGSALKEGDKLPLPLTIEETNSLKEVIGELYGYYNHEERTIFLTQTYAHLFMVFKTFLPGELRHYLKNPDLHTSRGKVTQARNAAGELLYELLDEERGILFRTTEATHKDKDGNDVPNDPVMDFRGEPIEGLLNSTIALIADVFTEKGREDLKNNKARRVRAEIFLMRCLLFGFLGALLAALIKGTGENELSTPVKQSYNILSKAAKDLSFYHSIIEPLDEAGFVGVDLVKDLTTHFVDMITDGDEGVKKMLYDVAAIKDTYLL